VGVFFINIEVILPVSISLDEGYLILWQEWIQENEIKIGLEDSFQLHSLKVQN
jgi:hypothetical protein